MADSNAMFTFEDPFQGVVEINPLLFPSKFAPNEGQNSSNFEDDQSGHENEIDDIFNTEDLLSDPFLWEVCNDPEFLTGNPQAVAEEGCLEDHSMAISTLPDPPQQSCACCQVLREITHTNGMKVKKLGIHGVFGVITHALLRLYDYASSFQTQDCQLFDFQKESTQTVKIFLVQYYEVCRQEGYSPLQDPLSTFYEALSVGFKEPDNTNDFLRFPPENTGDHQHHQSETSNRMGDGSYQTGVMKIPLAMQRERTRNLGMKDFVDYFDLPIGDAARRLNVCPTVMKKICRRHGVLRWPYRKIKSIERKISKSQKMLEESTDEERGRVLEDIEKYKQQLANVYAEFTK